MGTFLEGNREVFNVFCKGKSQRDGEDTGELSLQHLIWELGVSLSVDAGKFSWHDYSLRCM